MTAPKFGTANVSKLYFGAAEVAKLYLGTAVLYSSATVPGAPTIGTASAGNGQAVVTFTAPASDGGSAIIDYTVSYSTSSGGTYSDFSDGANSTALNRTVTGLTNGTPYWFKVRATNAVGTGGLSGTATCTPAAPGAAGAALLATLPFWWDATDYSGSGNLLNKGTVGAAGNMAVTGPTFSGGIFTFDGVNDYMTVGSHASLESDSTDFYAVVIFRQTGGAVNDGTFLTKFASSTNWYQIKNNGGGKTPIVSCKTPGSGELEAGGGTWTTAKTMIGMHVSGGTWKTLLNGVDGTGISDNRSPKANSGAFYIGSAKGNTQNWQSMEFFGAFISRVNLTSQNMTDILAYYGM